MYRKILVPLDGSPEAEQVVPIVDEILAPEGEAIFLKVINPSATENIGAGQVIHGALLAVQCLICMAVRTGRRPAHRTCVAQESHRQTSKAGN